MKFILCTLLIVTLAVAQFSSSNVMGKLPISVSGPADGCQMKLSSSVWVCSGGVTASDPGCAVTADLGKEWIDTTSSVTTHLKLCVKVASVLTWVQVI